MALLGRQGVGHFRDGYFGFLLGCPELLCFSLLCFEMLFFKEVLY